jgi:hypothetical protein
VSRRGSGWRQSYPCVQGVEASSMAKSAESRCTGALVISRRSFVWQQQDLDADDLDILAHKEDRNQVSDGREREGEVLV